MTNEAFTRRGMMLTGVAAAAGAMLFRDTPAQAATERSSGRANDWGGSGAGGARHDPDDNPPPPGEPGKDYNPVITPNGTTLPFKVINGVKVMHLIVEEVDHEFAPGLRARCWGYNGQVHGPTIEAVEGDRVRIYVTNRLSAATTIHWHGIILPSAMDGVGGLSQRSIAPGETFRYEFTLRQHGTFMYHSHHDEMTQMSMGLLGMIVIHPRNLPAAKRPDRDFVLMQSEWKIVPGTYRPDPNEMTDFNVLTFNARAYPGTAPLVARLGDKVRIRLGNLSAMDHHPIHLHGYYFMLTATDGGEIAESAQHPETTVLTPVGSTRTVQFIADNPGDWAMHCHMTHHVMNQMGHGIPNLIGAKTEGFDGKVRPLLPGPAAGADTTAPFLRILKPTPDEWSQFPEIVLLYGDGGSGINESTLSVKLNRPLGTGNPATGGVPAGADISNLFLFRDGRVFISPFEDDKYLPSGNATLAVSIADVAGNVATLQRTFQVNVLADQLPFAQISRGAGDPPLTVALSGASSSDPDGVIMRWEWYFPDGTTALGKDVNWTAPAPGEYEAELYVWDDRGGVAEAEVDLDLLSPTVTQSTFAVQPGPNQLQVSFSENVLASLTSSDLVLQNLTSGATVPVSSIVRSYDAKTNTATFTFPGLAGGLLPDGSYRATLLAFSVADGSGNPLAADLVHNFIWSAGTSGNDVFRVQLDPSGTSVQVYLNNATTPAFGALYTTLASIAVPVLMPRPSTCSLATLSHRTALTSTAVQTQTPSLSLARQRPTA